MRAPPHRCVLENPKKLVRRTDTCHGQRPNGAFLPPTMRVSGRVWIEGIPHSAERDADTVKEPGCGEIGSRTGSSVVVVGALSKGRTVESEVDEYGRDVVVVNAVELVLLVLCVVLEVVAVDEVECLVGFV